MDPKAIITEYKEFLNSRDTEGLSRIVAETLIFVDSAGHTIMGKQACLDAWDSFCKLFPDYMHIFEEIVVLKNKVSIRGYSTCSDHRVAGPVLWSAKVKNEKVEEWRVYKDSRENRERLGVN